MREDVVKGIRSYLSGEVVATGEGRPAGEIIGAALAAVVTLALALVFLAAVCWWIFDL